MPSSLMQGKEQIFNWVSTNANNINNILDIGVGEGTYFNLLSSIKEFTWSGIEAWEPYIKKYELEKKYNTIFHCDVRNFGWNKRYDLVIAGDVLEHMTKQDAILLVEKILDNSNMLIISIPVVYMPQDEFEDNPFEIHVKPDWSVEEVRSTWGNKIKAEWRKGKKSPIGVFWLSTI